MPHALIVDDSKTARYALRLLLDKQHFTADMVESAEQALEYLNTHAPDLIFMDHMMPGMDGFQAVKAIKSNRNTAGIPIVMYTSTQGGVYFGQARALGAADVISKPASAEDLTAVLQRLEEHRLLGAGKIAHGENEHRTSAPLTIEYDTDDESETTAAPVAPQPAPTASNATPVYAESRAPRWPLWLTGASLALVLGVLVLYLGSLNERMQLEQQRLLAIKTVEWALNEAQEFPYGEPPFGGDRLPRWQELVQRLSELGFRGTIRLESHVGEFCLLRLPGGETGANWVVAPPELKLTDCTALGQSTEQSQQLSAAQSAAFKRFQNELPSGIALELVPLGAREPKRDYPNDPDVRAGEWNRVAQRNQRVHIVLLPAGAPTP